jgi:hypothetical protein
MEAPRRGGSSLKPVRSLLSRAISTILAARCDACSENGVKPRHRSGGTPRQSLSSFAFFHAGFSLAGGSFSLVAARFPHAPALSFVAFFFLSGL